MSRLLLIIAIITTAMTELPAASPDSVRYELQLQQSLTDSDHTPFWLSANRQGMGSTRPDGGMLRAALWKSMDYNRRWDWAAGIDLLGAWNFTSSFVIRQLYGSIRYRPFELTIGSKLLDERYSDSRLGSGDMLYSGNALPLPQARISIPNWLDVPGLGGWFGIKGYFSYGMFTDSNWQRSWVPQGKQYSKNVLFHSKGLHMHIGRLDSRFYFEGSLEMAAQFGGKMMIGDSVVINMPNGVKDFIKVLIPSGGGSDTPLGEQTNIYGNHEGEWSARLTWRPAEGWQFRPYYIHYFDDHSMMFLDYVWRDCLAGLHLTVPRNRWVSHLVYEYLYTKDQSGPVYWDHTDELPEQVSGCDDYYNHCVYQSVQHWGMGLGNPLIISPIYNKDHSMFFECNRVVGHHIGVDGNPSDEWAWRVLASYTRGWGRYSSPYYMSPYHDVKTNFNLLLEAQWIPRRLAGWSATLGLGIDRGSILGNAVGVQFSISKTGIL